MTIVTYTLRYKLFVLVCFFFCLILLAKISARFSDTPFSRLGDAFVKFFCSFSSIDCYICLFFFSNVSSLKFKFHFKCILFVLILTAGKQVLFGSTNQATNLYDSHLRCSLSMCVFMLRFPSLSRWNIHNGEKGDSNERFLNLYRYKQSLSDLDRVLFHQDLWYLRASGSHVFN